MLNCSLCPKSLCTILLNQGIVHTDTIISVLTEMLFQVSDNSKNSSPRPTCNPVGITVQCPYISTNIELNIKLYMNLYTI